MKVASKLCNAILLISLLSACSELDVFEDDIIVDQDNLTMTVSVNNMEAIAASVIDSSYLAFQYLPLFNALDAADFAEIACVTGDIVTSADTAAGEVHRRGDSLSINYRNCVLANGDKIDGSVEVDYRDLDGLNNRFVAQSTGQCITELSDDIGDDVRIYENLFVVDGENEYLEVDDIVFTDAGNGVRAEYRLVDGTLRTIPDGDFSVIPENVTENSFDLIHESAIFIIRSLEEDPDRSTPTDIKYRINGDVPASMQEFVNGSLVEGDRVFDVRDGESRLNHEAKCQDYGREVRVSVNDLEIDRAGAANEVITFDGNVTFSEVSENFDVFFDLIDRGDFNIEYIREQLRSSYRYTDFTVVRTRNTSGNSIAQSVNGLLQSDRINGRAQINTALNIQANDNDYIPHIGNLEAVGVNLETVNVIFRGTSVIVNAATEGDIDGSGQADIDEQFTTFWQDLLDRNFLRSDD